jgi:hypothetical protein
MTDVAVIVNAIREAYSKYGYTVFGIRTGKAKNVGTYCALSFDGSDYAETNTRLNGTCATGISFGYEPGYNSDDPEDVEALADMVRKALEKNDGYLGEMVYLVGGERGDYGDDDSEIIINNNDMWRRRGAKVLAIIK